MRSFVRTRPVVDAIQWNRFGDHPLVFQILPEWEGWCSECNAAHSAHGWLALADGTLARVCPASWVVVDEDGVVAPWTDRAFRDAFHPGRKRELERLEERLAKGRGRDAWSDLKWNPSRLCEDTHDDDW